MPESDVRQWLAEQHRRERRASKEAALLVEVVAALLAGERVHISAPSRTEAERLMRAAKDMAKRFESQQTCLAAQSGPTA